MKRLSLRQHRAAGTQRPSGPAFQAVQRYTDEPAWPTVRSHLIALAAETGEHPLRYLLTAASGGNLRTADDLAAVLDWRLTALTPTDPGPMPWLPGIPPALQADPAWGGYLAKRSQLVANLVDQVQDHLCQHDWPPAWAGARDHPTALDHEIGVWRAANGINPKDPRPTGEGGRLDTAAAWWKQRLDWQIARSKSGSERFKERQAAQSALSRSHRDRRRPYQTPGPSPNGPAAPRR